jgi:hypothetical protein
MASKIYRTALGKLVDMGSIVSSNETVRAVGNMGVNARGDVLNNKNSSVLSRNTQVNNQYRKQIQNQVVDAPVGTASMATNTIVKQELDPAETIEGLDTTPAVTEEVVVETTTSNTAKKTGGLASAIAKAREVEQKKLKTPREEARGKTGVKKI